MSTESVYTASVKNKENLGEQYLVLTLDRPTGFQFQAGQYVTFQIQDEQGSFDRSYSIASGPSSLNILEFCIQTVGDGRAAFIFKNLADGDHMTFSAASGQFGFSKSKLRGNHAGVDILIAGGSGISPLRSMILEKIHSESTSDLKLLYGCRDISAFPFKKEFLTLQAQGWIQCQLLADNGSEGDVAQGNPVETLKRDPNWIDNTAQYFLCGPPGFVQTVKATLSTYGISSDKIFIEDYSI